MNHAIPTTPQDDPADTIMAALAHGLTGHPEKAGPLFEPFLSGPTTAVSLFAALAETAVGPSRRTLPADGAFGLLVLDAETGQHGGVDDLPAGVRFAAQFTAAWANDQRKTAYALFNALVAPGDDAAAIAVADATRALFDMAVVTLKQQTGAAS
jgi:hypothetical protein